MLVEKGRPDPRGARLDQDGVNFALYSKHATRVELCLFESVSQNQESRRIPLLHRTEDTWHARIPGLKSGALYGYRVYGPWAPAEGHRFNPHKILLDPHARGVARALAAPQDYPALSGHDRDSPRGDLQRCGRDSAGVAPLGVVLPEIRPPRPGPEIDWRDTIIYEAHVRGATAQYEKIAPRLRGTYGGIASDEFIKHLGELGVTTVQLMPVHEIFDEESLKLRGLTNYWGYNTLSYFAPTRRYATAQANALECLNEFRDMVDRLHDNNLEVILDVVYNHTAESDRLGPTLSLRGIDNKSYYKLKTDPRYYTNHSWCGNTPNTDHNEVIRLICDSLRYWATELGVDGFRFDLAGVLSMGAGEDAEETPESSSLFRAIEQDPVLRGKKLIAEPWSPGVSRHRTGRFLPPWREWNDEYRDTLRRFWRGEKNLAGSFATRMAGSSDLFEVGRGPLASVNFYGAHDGFTLTDLVSYKNKHNEKNGEKNQDGQDENFSHNFGVEGETDDAEINKTRRKQKRNFLACLFFAQGIPMIQGGDELGRTLKGNNNAYCQDNEINYINWRTPGDDLRAYIARLIRLRKTHESLRRNEFFQGRGETPDIRWLGPEGELTSEGWAELETPGMWLTETTGDLLIYFNPLEEEREITPPAHIGGNRWRVLLDTAQDIDRGINARREEYVTDRFQAAARSLVLLKAEAKSYRHAALRREKIHSAGLELDYYDIAGKLHKPAPETVDKILESFSGREPVSAPTNETFSPGGNKLACTPSVLKGATKTLGVFLQLYGLRSETNAGFGDFNDLRELGRILSRRGVALLGLNPLHALFFAEPNRRSPYSPSSRLRGNPLYLHVLDLPGARDSRELRNILADPEFQADLKKEQDNDWLDYENIHRRKLKLFEIAFNEFRLKQKAEPDANLARKFQDFREREGEELSRFAIFEALGEYFLTRGLGSDFLNWPEQYRSPDSDATRVFALKHSERILFFEYLQWNFKTQLEDTVAALRENGLCLYLDLAVGVHPGGAEVWSRPEMFARGVHIGAPPDSFSPEGQDWGLAPIRPDRIARDNFAHFRKILRASMPREGLIRVDHVAALRRLFWVIPDPPRDSPPGTYVRYPLERLLRVVQEESQARQCGVIGEDLGTLPAGLSQELQAAGLYSWRVFYFNPEVNAYPERGIATLNTHDLPPLKAYLEAGDLETQKELGRLSSAEYVRELEKRKREIQTLEGKLSERGLLKFSGDAGPGRQEKQNRSFADMSLALHQFLMESPGPAVLINLQDIMGDDKLLNLPGTVDEYPNWARRYPWSLKELEENIDGEDSLLRSVHAMRTSTSSE